MVSQNMLNIASRQLFALTVFILTAFQTSSGQGRLPERAFDVKGGAIGVQAGVMRGSLPGLPLLGKPTVYFIILRNETDSTVWPEVKLYLKKSPLKGHGEIKKGKLSMFSWDSYGVKKDEEIPLEIFIYGDKKQKTLLGSETTHLYFEGDDIEAFFKIPFYQKKGQAPVISGWREMGNNPEYVPGTRADSALQQDIIWTLYKMESKSQKDCQHSVVKAEPSESDQSMIAKKTGGEAQRLAEKLGAGGEMFLEKWHVKSCEVVSIYEVLLLKSLQGGTDIMVEKLGEEGSEQ